jgi:putative PEP-CTERM system TPR-repeat lipoprotein
MKRFSFMAKLVVPLLLVFCLFGCERKTKEQLLEKGIELRKAANPTGAVVLFKNALEKDPNYLEARLQLGLAYLDGGNFSQAEKELAKVLLQNPQNGEVLLHLANVHLHDKAPDQALEYVDRFLREHSPSPEAFELKGKAHALKGELKRAEQAYKKALELDKKHVGAHNSLARLYSGIWRLAEARKLLQESLDLDQKNKEALYLLLHIEKLAGNMDEAIAVGQHLIDLYPDEVMAPYLVGLIELAGNDTAAAGKLADDLLARRPKHPIGFRLQGLVLQAEGKYSEAVEKFQQSQQQLQDAVDRFYLGLSHYQLGEFELALNQFQAVLDEDPENVRARLLVAQTLYRQKRYADSRAAAELALKADPDNALAHDILGSDFLAEGNFDRGMEAFDRAIALNPNLVDAQLKKGVFNLTRGKVEQAEDQLEEVVRLAPELLNSRILLAVSYLKRQNFKDAIALLRDGLQGRPEDAVLHNYLAAALLGQGQTENGLAELVKAKQCKPDYLAPYVNLANYQLSKARPEKAAAEYLDFLKVDPGNLRALLSLAALQELQGDKKGVVETLARAAATGEVEGFRAQALYRARNGQQEEAMASLDAGLERYPGNAALLELKADVLLQQGKPAEALMTLRNLAEVAPARGLPLLVATLVRENRLDEAEEIARREIDRSASESRGYLLLAGIYKEKKEFDKGVEILEQGLKKVGDKTILQMARADILSVSGRVERAREVYEKINRENPGYIPATFSLAAIHDKQGDKRQALALYRACLDQDEDYVPALNNLAYLYVENYRELDKALDLATRALRHRPNDPGIMDTLGYVMVRQGRFADALPFLEKSAGLLQKEPAVQYHLALAYQGLGRNQQAEKALEKVVAAGDPVLSPAAENLLQQVKRK